MELIYCFNEEDKKELLLSGFKFMHSCKMGDKDAYVFQGDCKKLNFSVDKSKYLVTNKMYF